MRLIICRTRQVVGCNGSTLSWKSVWREFVSMPHAAGGRLQHQYLFLTGCFLLGFNAARGRWSVATGSMGGTHISGIMGFNAARGRWSVATCSTRSAQLQSGCVSMPHAAGGRLQRDVATAGDLMFFQGFNAARGRWSVATL